MQTNTSLAVHDVVVNAADVNCVIVAVVLEVAVCLVRNSVVDVALVTSSQCTAQPVVAVGNPITPGLVTVPVPTLMVKAAVPLFAVIDAPVPKPEEIVGAASAMYTRAAAL